MNYLFLNVIFKIPNLKFFLKKNYVSFDETLGCGKITIENHINSYYSLFINKG